MAEDTSDWPGDRQPTQLEIERAHEIAEPTVQQEFKRALLANGAAQAYKHTPSVVLDHVLQQSADSPDDLDDDVVRSLLIWFFTTPNV